MTTLADRLKAVRESIGTGQKEMASQCGVSYRAWQGYETDENQPSTKVIEALVKLGFNANWLLTGDGEMKLGPERGTLAYILDKERQAEVDESIKKYGAYPLDKGLLKRSYNGALDFFKEEGVQPTPDMVFEVMMQRYTMLAMFKSGLHKMTENNKSDNII